MSLLIYLFALGYIMNIKPAKHTMHTYSMALNRLSNSNSLTQIVLFWMPLLKCQESKLCCCQMLSYYSHTPIKIQMQYFLFHASSRDLDHPKSSNTNRIRWESTEQPRKPVHLRFDWILLGSSDESILVSSSRAGVPVDFRVRSERALLAKLTAQSPHTHSVLRRQTSILLLSHHDPLTHTDDKFTHRSSPAPVSKHPKRKRQINEMLDPKTGQPKLHSPSTTLVNHSGSL